MNQNRSHEFIHKKKRRITRRRRRKCKKVEEEENEVKERQALCTRHNVTMNQQQQQNGFTFRISHTVFVCLYMAILPCFGLVVTHYSLFIAF